MKCENHPAANAAEQCVSCKAPLCGMCCNFEEEGVYCDRCLAALESKRKLEAEVKRREEPRSEIVYDDPESEESKQKSERNKDKVVVWGVILAFATIGAVQLYRYGNPSGVGLTAAEQARNQQLVSMVQCAGVYRQIGLLLAESRNVPADLLCMAQPAPHIVTRDGDLVKYSHPNPQVFGYTEISVTNANPQPNMILALN